MLDCLHPCTQHSLTEDAFIHLGTCSLFERTLVMSFLQASSVHCTDSDLVVRKKIITRNSNQPLCTDYRTLSMLEREVSSFSIIDNARVKSGHVHVYFNFMRSILDDIITGRYTNGA
jgi:hypothetical protein